VVVEIALFEEAPVIGQCIIVLGVAVIVIVLTEGVQELPGAPVPETGVGAPRVIITVEMLVETLGVQELTSPAAVELVEQVPGPIVNGALKAGNPVPSMTLIITSVFAGNAVVQVIDCCAVMPTMLVVRRW
jgi:hypothetical protein